MNLTVRHIYTQTVPDSTATSLVRPSDWNSVHAVSMNLVGTDLTNAFGTNGNVTFGTDAGGFMTANAPSGGGPTYVFSNSNGVSFGTNGNTVTATVKTDYLTTAMQSDAGSNFVAASAALEEQFNKVRRRLRKAKKKFEAEKRAKEEQEVLDIVILLKLLDKL